MKGGGWDYILEVWKGAWLVLVPQDFGGGIQMSDKGVSAKVGKTANWYQFCKLVCHYCWATPTGTGSKWEAASCSFSLHLSVSLWCPLMEANGRASFSIPGNCVQPADEP